MSAGDNKERIYWIDWVKVFAIILVVWGHVSPFWGNQIYLFHMPLFFMVSGYLYHARPRKPELFSILYTIIFPYLIYNFIYLLPLPLGGTHNVEDVINIFVGNQEQLSYLFIPLWFLVALSVIRLLCVSHIDVKITGSICIILSIIFNVALSEAENDYYQGGTSLLCFPFFAIGHELRKLTLPSWSTTIKVSVSIFCVVLFVLISTIAGGESYNVFHCRTGSSILLFYFVTSSMCVIFLILVFCIFNFQCKIIETLSNGTLLILATHLIIYWKIPQFTSPELLFQVVSLLIILFVSYWLIYYSERFCPVLIGKMKKK